MFKLIPCAALLALLVGCATPEPKEVPLEGIVSITAGPCLGLCPEFTMSVGPDDRYELIAGPNTIKQGRSTGGLPFGAFRRALDVLDLYDFQSLRRGYVSADPRTCPDSVSGTPTLTIELEGNRGNKELTYEVGCLDFPEKDSIDQMIADLYRVFRVNDLVAVGEPPKVKDKSDSAF